VPRATPTDSLASGPRGIEINIINPSLSEKKKSAEECILERSIAEGRHIRRGALGGRAGSAREGDWGGVSATGAF